MKKIKSVISLIKKSEKPFLTFLEILWIISQIPIIIIHEASHFLFIFLTGCKFKIDFERWKFISSDTVISDDGEPVIKMTRYTFPITLIGKNMIKKMIVALAPFFGIVVYLFLTFFIPICIIANPLTSIIICTIMAYYFLFNYDVFWISSDDRKCYKESYHNYKAIKEAKKRGDTIEWGPSL